MTRDVVEVPADSIRDRSTVRRYPDDHLGHASNRAFNLLNLCGSRAYASSSCRNHSRIGAGISCGPQFQMDQFTQVTKDAVRLITRPSSEHVHGDLGPCSMRPALREPREEREVAIACTVKLGLGDLTLLLKERISPVAAPPASYRSRTCPTGCRRGRLSPSRLTVRSRQGASIRGACLRGVTVEVG